MVEQSAGGSRLEPLSVLWRLLAAPPTLLLMMGLVALALLLGTLLPQIPPQAAGDPQAWLAAQTGLFRQASDFVRALGLFDLYHAFWFRLLLALTGLALFVRAVESAELAWLVIGRKPWTVAALTSWGSRAPQFHLPSPLSSDEVIPRLHKLWTQAGYWSADVAAAPVRSLVAGRRRAAFWARPLGYGALLLALLGLVIDGIWGWQGEQWQPAPGESRVVDHGLPYTLRLDAFTVQQGADQQLRNYHSEVTWLEGDAELGHDLVGLGRPATHRGLAARQVGYAPLVRIRGRDQEGRPLTLETGADVLSVTGEAEIHFSSPEAQPLVLIADRDVFLALTFETSCDAAVPALTVDLVDSTGTERQRVGILYASGPLSVDGLQLDVELTFVPILLVDFYPGMGLVVAGMALFVVALLVSWLASPRLAWIMLAPGEEEHTIIRVMGPPGAATNRWLPQLARRLREVVGDGA
jgi:hypothetical protein